MPGVPAAGAAAKSFGRISAAAETRRPGAISTDSTPGTSSEKSATRPFVRTGPPTRSGVSGYEGQPCRARDPGNRLVAGRGVTTAPHEEGEDEMCSVRQREDPRVVRAGPDGPGLVEDVRALREARPQPAVARRAPAHRV